MDAISRRIRRTILEIAHKSGHGHIPTCFSVIEMLRAIYATMRHDPARPDWPARDRFVLSKGHAALGHYCVLSELGYFPIEGVFGFGNFGSRFGCHADRHKVPGIEVSTGSLGHGIPVAAGMALGGKIDGSSMRVFTIIGDGEANEGSVWEAIMVAADQKLDNLTILYDDNRSQGRCLSIPNPLGRFEAFGCAAIEVDGHDLAALEAALAAPSSGKPKALVCKTGKGWGARTLVDNVYEWHRRSPDAAGLAQLLEEVDAWPL